MEREIERPKEENEKLRKQINGERVMGNYCKACANSYNYTEVCDGAPIPYTRTVTGCRLNLKCKDFKTYEDEANNSLG